MVTKQLVDQPKRISKWQAFNLAFERGMNIGEFKSEERSAADLRLVASCTLKDAHSAFSAQYGEISRVVFVRFLKRVVHYVCFHRCESGCVHLSGVKLNELSLSAVAVRNRK